MVLYCLEKNIYIQLKIRLSKNHCPLYMYACKNKCLFSFCLKVSTDCESFIDCGRLFQSTAAANTKDRPPYDLRLNTGFVKRLLVEERSDLEGLYECNQMRNKSN